MKWKEKDREINHGNEGERRIHEKKEKWIRMKNEKKVVHMSRLRIPLANTTKKMWKKKKKEIDSTKHIVQEIERERERIWWNEERKKWLAPKV
jgi:hypothetical protein